MQSSEVGTDRAEPRVDGLPDRSPVVSDEEAYALQREETRMNYFLAGVLFIGGGFGAIIPDALHEPAQPTTIYLLPLLAVVSGLIVWALASRMPRRYLHVVAVVAALEVALTVGLADRMFSTYFTFVAIFAAYVFTSRRAIAAHIGFVAALCFAPLVYSPGTARDMLLMASILVPTLVLAGGAVAYLRERLESSEARYRKLSELDPLTGVGNYRMLSLRVPRELRRHGRSNMPLSLLVFDLDGFKRVNDEYGHQRGDAVLQSVAQALSDGVRDHDIVVRQGGDEFAVVAPETDQEAGLALAGRLCSAISEISPDGVRIGASMGSAIFPHDADSLERLLAVADARLREKKLDSLISYRRTPAGVEPAPGDRSEAI
jgi:diguanylate cyclase (GGDEF)-like protein